MGNVFVEKIRQSISLEHAINAGRLREQPARFRQRFSAPCELLQEFCRFSEVLEQMPDNDGVWLECRHVHEWFKQARVELDSRSSPHASIRIEANESPMLAQRLCNPANEMAFATTDLNHRWRTRQLHKEHVASTR